MGVKRVPDRRGIVIESEGKSCIVLTPEGEFRRVPLAGRSVRLGEELIFEEPAGGTRLRLRPWLLAACLVLAAVIGLWYPLHPAVAYWVSLDINPSLELGVNDRGRVVKVVPLDAAAKTLVSGQKLKGRSAEEALVGLVMRSAALGFLKGPDDVVLLALAGDEKGMAEEQAKLTRAVEASLARLSVKSQVVVAGLGAGAHAEAQQMGLSAGRYAVWRALKENGVNLEPSELKTKNLGQLVRERKKDLRALLAQPREGSNGPPPSPVFPAAGQSPSQEPDELPVQQAPPSGQERPILRPSFSGPKGEKPSPSPPGQAPVEPGQAKGKKAAPPAAESKRDDAGGQVRKAAPPAQDGERQPAKLPGKKAKQEKEKSLERQKVHPELPGEKPEKGKAR